MKNILLAGVVGFGLVLGGCATSRGLIEIPSPQHSLSSQEIPSSKKAVIVIVNDNRAFQEKPPTPDIASLRGGLSKATAEDKARAIARKRNGYGKALGDILLKNESVSELLEKRATNALQGSGYEVLANNDANKENADMILTIKMNKFWSWMQPGFASIKIHSEIDTDIINGKNLGIPPIHVYTKVSKSVQIANGAKWVENINQVLNDYEVKLIASLPITTA